MVFIEKVTTGIFGESYSNPIITSRKFYKIILRDRNRAMKGIYGEHEVYEGKIGYGEGITNEENWDV